MNVIKINVVEIVNSIIDAFVTRFNIQPVWLPLAVSARCVCVCVCVHACVCVLRVCVLRLHATASPRFTNSWQLVYCLCLLLMMSMPPL